MEKVGILVDREYLKKFQAQVNKDMVTQLKELRKGFKVGEDFNFGSSDQLGDLLYNQLGFEVKHKTFKGNPSCDDEALSKMEHPYIKHLREFKLNETYLTKFIDPWLKFSEKDGRMHASFNTNGAVSGRFTCNEPNMQQVMKDPKVLRGLMVTPGKVRGHSDLCQIEMVGAAWYMRDAQMLTSLRAGTDLHKDTASVLFSKPASEITKRERQIAKGMNFSVVYGCGKAKLAGFLSNHTGSAVSLEEADKIRSLYHAKYPGIKRFVYKVMDVIRSRNDRTIKNYFGRRYYIPPQKEYVGVNRLVQGWAADMTKRSMVKVAGKLNWSSNYMDVQVHDMIGWECDPKEQKDVQHEIEKAMTDWPEFDVPVKVETDIKQKTWEA
jgi:DNA polymerase-1